MTVETLTDVPNITVRLNNEVKVKLTKENKFIINHDRQRNTSIMMDQPYYNPLI